MKRKIKFRASYKGKEYDVTTKLPLHKDAKGIHKRQGYIVRLTSNHPFADKRGYVLEHRLVMEQHLGRFLTENEVIHHKDGVRDNNELSNLQLMDDQRSHAEIEMTGKRNPNGRIVAQEPIFDDIKFRLLNKNTKLTEIFTLSKLIGTTFRRGQFKFRGRCTGLLDRNGVEIYEGDIIRFVNGNAIHTLGEDSDMRVVEVLEDTKQLGWKGSGYTFCENNCKKLFEVIGNIYENPELLKHGK